MQRPTRQGRPQGGRQGQLDPVRTRSFAARGRPGPDHQIIARPNPGHQARSKDFAAAAGWRPGFDDPQHERQIILTLESTHAICPRCAFDLIGQERPDCPECAWIIDPAKLIFPDAPPKPGYRALLIAGTALHWIAMLLTCIAIPAAPTAGTLLLMTLFLIQLATSWRLLAVTGNQRAWRHLDAIKRKPHWYGAFASVALGIAGVIGAFLLWMLS